MWKKKVVMCEGTISRWSAASKLLYYQRLLCKWLEEISENTPGQKDKRRLAGSMHSADTQEEWRLIAVFQ